MISMNLASILKQESVKRQWTRLILKWRKSFQKKQHLLWISKFKMTRSSLMHIYSRNCHFYQNFNDFLTKTLYLIKNTMLMHFMQKRKIKGSKLNIANTLMKIILVLPLKVKALKIYSLLSKVKNSSKFNKLSRNATKKNSHQ